MCYDSRHATLSTIATTGGSPKMTINDQEDETFGWDYAKWHMYFRGPLRFMTIVHRNVTFLIEQFRRWHREMICFTDDLGKLPNWGTVQCCVGLYCKKTWKKISVLIIWWTENTEINFTWLWRSWIVYQIDSQKKRENIK